MTYMCKKCGRTIPHEQMWSRRIPWDEFWPDGGPSASGSRREEGMPAPLAECPYCGHYQEKDGDRWFYKHYELRNTWRDAVRHQRNVSGAGE